MSAASTFGKAEEARESLELTEEEAAMRESIRTIWKGILLKDIDGETDFFASGQSIRLITTTCQMRYAALSVVFDPSINSFVSPFVKRVCPSVRRSVRNAFVKNARN